VEHDAIGLASEVAHGGEARVRGDAALRALERPFLALDRLLARVLPDALNPFLQTGAVAVTAILVAVVSGVLLLFWYRPSVHLAYSSVAAMSDSPASAGLLRSLHRYSSDAAIFFALVHAARLFFERRFAGARWLAWVTGVFSLVVVWVLGWTGYWLVWDVRGKYVALETARLLDVLPIFADPMGRSFLFDEGINSLLFFVVFFFHMLAPLALAFVLWLHLTRTARARFLTRLPMTIWVLGTLAILSVAYPATNAEPAKMTARGESFGMDWWYLFPLSLGQQLSGGAIWAVCLLGGALAVSAPWTLRKRVGRSAMVDPARCNACEQCYRDCPYEAISMIPRANPVKREKYATEAFVDPAKCISCGICVASCNSIGTDLPGFPLRDQRQRVATWLDAAKAGGDSTGVAFVCAQSAGGGLEIDPETGICRELPGWRVLEVPCAGWVHSMSIELALRRGAKKVLIASCPPGSCHFREGPEFLDQHLAGTRPPAIREKFVTPDAVEVVYLDRGSKRELLKAAGAALKGSSPSSSAAPGRALAGIASVAVAFVTSAIIGVVSDWGHAAHAPPGAELVVTFKHPGERSEVCRERTPEELAQLPQHMRQAKVCERARAAVRLRVSVDGERRVDHAYSPSGIWSDGSSVAVVPLSLTPGEHAIRVEIGDSHDPDDWSHVSEQTIEFDERFRRVIAFDRASGFKLH
jgi:ferredoxin